MFAEKSDNDIRVMTYDSLVSQCESVPYNGEKIILSTWKEQGFKIKKLPKQEISTSLFAYLRPEYLQISERDIEILKEQDYQIDIWLSGRALSYNDKYDAASLAERTTNPLTKAVLLAEAKITNNQGKMGEISYPTLKIYCILSLCSIKSKFRRILKPFVCFRGNLDFLRFVG
ncbi:hypothetical protein C823_006152 [Eubacterium plexicaudatum ASF492]|nr:hypothetical protein C823_006152 [Eubacterium plexicaudatum ASF492]